MTSLTPKFVVERWSAASQVFVGLLVVSIVLLAIAPTYLEAGVIERLTVLFIYIILAAMWNALAGYGGLISIGQQLFFGLGAYFCIRLADAGLDPFVSVVVSSLIVTGIAWPISFFMLRLRGGEFAIGMWVLAALAHLLVNLDGLIQGETGTSLIALNNYVFEVRRLTSYWLSLASMTFLLACLFLLLRSKVGASFQAIRDDEDAAQSVGIDITRSKRILFIFAAFGIALAGALWLASATTFQPKTYFSVQWTAYMIFMVLVGGIGRFEGAIVGAILFFAIETWFGDTGVVYLIGLGATALLFSIFLPKGLWGAIETRFDIQLLPVGYRVRFGKDDSAD